MESRHRFGLAIGMTLVAALLGALAAPDLPAHIVVNWDAAGEPGGTMDRTLGLAMLPGLMVVLLGLFALVPRIDPLRENIASFRTHYDWFVVMVVGFLGLVHLGIVAFNLGYTFDFPVLLLAGMAMLYYYIGVVLERAERNWFVGVRTPWTLSDDEVWARTHAIAAPLFKGCGVLAAAGMLFESYAIYFAVGPVLVTSALTVVYSYYVYEKLDGGDPAQP